MLTLTYGYKKPETNDQGPIVFPALEFDIQRLNDHNHDGSNSAPLAGSVIVGGTFSVPSGDWVSQGNGLYKQTVSLPAGYTYDAQTMSFRLSTGEYVYPKVERASVTQVIVWTNNNTLTYTGLIGG